jgi:hypothetical protein
VNRLAVIATESKPARLRHQGLRALLHWMNLLCEADQLVVVLWQRRTTVVTVRGMVIVGAGFVWFPFESSLLVQAANCESCWDLYLDNRICRDTLHAHASPKSLQNQLRIRHHTRAAFQYPTTNRIQKRKRKKKSVAIILAAVDLAMFHPF